MAAPDEQVDPKEFVLIALPRALATCWRDCLVSDGLVCSPDNAGGLDFWRVTARGAGTVFAICEYSPDLRLHVMQMNMGRAPIDLQVAKRVAAALEAHGARRFDNNLENLVLRREFGKKPLKRVENDLSDLRDAGPV